MIRSFLDWLFGDSDAAELDRFAADQARHEFQAIQDAVIGPHGSNAELAGATAKLVLNAGFPQPLPFAASLMLKFYERCDDLHIPLPHDNIIIEMCAAAAGFYADEEFHRVLPDLPADDDPAYTVAIGRARDFLLRQQVKALDPAATLEALSNAIIESYMAIARCVPALAHARNDPPASSGATIPLIDILPSVGQIIERAIEPFSSPEAVRYGLFRDVREQLNHNSAKLAERLRAKQPPTPSEYDAPPSDVVSAYLAHTLLDAIFLESQVTFDLPQEQRFSGHWIIAPPGRGKTTLLHSMFLDDVKRDASIIVMDSKGDLINPIKELQAVENRLILIEPDPDHPLALNPLDIPKTNIAHTVSLLEYIFSALLEAKMTALQMTLFRSVLPALVEVVPNATLETFRDIIENGTSRYNEYIDTLSPDLKDFFYRHFDSKTYAETRTQLIWRLQFLMTNPIIRQMFSALKTKLDIGNEMDAGKIILIDNSKQKLGDEGAEFFGRFFIALVLAAAQQRAGRPQSEKLACYFYIDECQNVIRRDEKISTILDECRSQKIAMIMAHQRSAQITSPNVLDALANCAIRMANSDDEAKYLADKLRTSPEFLRSLPRGTFATFIRDLTPTALALKISYTNLSTLPRMSTAEQQVIRQRMRAQFSFAPQKPGAPAPQASPPTPAAVSPCAGADVRKAPPASPPKTTSGPGAIAKHHTEQKTVAPTDPHTGDHTEPSSKWGE
ncbi:MAG: hypothetical protein WBW73_14765 [Rhodoplanes sp.]